MKKTKISQGQIIVTVLILLLIIAIFSVASVFILRIIRERARFDISNIKANINRERTFYDASQEVLYVTIQRSPGKGNMSAVKLVIETANVNPPTRTCIRENYPDELGSKFYSISGMPFKPSSVTLAIIARADGSEKTVSLDKIQDIKESAEGLDLSDIEFGGGCGDIGFLPLEPPEP